MNEDSQLRMKWLYHLTTPRILKLIKNETQVPYIFKLVPTDFCYTIGLEHYVLEFVNIKNNEDVK